MRELAPIVALSWKLFSTVFLGTKPAMALQNENKALSSVRLVFLESGANRVEKRKSCGVAT